MPSPKSLPNTPPKRPHMRPKGFKPTHLHINTNLDEYSPPANNSSKSPYGKKSPLRTARITHVYSKNKGGKRKSMRQRQFTRKRVNSK